MLHIQCYELNSFFKIKRNVSKIIKMLSMHYVFYVIIANIFETFFPFFFNSITLIRYYCFKRSPDILFFTCENETRVHCRCTRTTSDTIVKFELIVEYVTRPLKKKKKNCCNDKGKQNIFLLFIHTSYYAFQISIFRKFTGYFIDGYQSKSFDV